MPVTLLPRRSGAPARALAIGGLTCIVLAVAGSTSARGASKLDHAIRELGEGRPADALKTIEKVLDRIAPRIAPDRAGEEALAAALLYRAVAEFELGRKQEARWSWHMALIFRPELEELNLAPLGPAGLFLKEDAAREPEGVEAIPDDHRDDARLASEGIHAPVRVSHVFPEYFEELRVQRVEGKVSVAAWVRLDGKLDSPRLVTVGAHPALVYSTLEAMRSWSFEPARRKGEPFVAWYSLEVRFELGR